VNGWLSAGAMVVILGLVLWFVWWFEDDHGDHDDWERWFR
jgi:high-affinity Fe2+/Pb2+ permease